MKTQNKFKTSHAFTIVELLVVIVIIAILATITIVSYAGIREKAVVATIQSDLKNASTQIEIYKTEHEVYPASVTDCPTPADSNICITPSKGNSISSYTADNSANPPTYSLTISNTSAGLSYKIDQNNSLNESISGWKMIAVNNQHTCAVGLNNKAYCWGWNSKGQLGNNSAVSSSVPVAVDTSGALSGKTIKTIMVGSGHSCAVASDDLAYCWGYNGSGQLGNNSTVDSSVPVAVDTSGVLSSKTVKAVTGYGYTCAIASDNQAYCWGDGSQGKLGNNSTASSSIPVAVNTSGVLSGKTVKAISSDVSHTCVIASDNQAYCWGSNNYGELGNNSTASSSIPVAVNTSGVLSGKTIKAISASGYHTCIIASDNQAYCWGINNVGQLGNNSTTQSSVPVAVDTSGVLSGKTIKAITGTCAIASDNNAYCWGYNSSGQLGNNSTDQSLVPVAVYTSGILSGKTITSISAGDMSVCTVASDNQAYCWGNNNYGKLGNNSLTNSSVPVMVVLP